MGAVLHAIVIHNMSDLTRWSVSNQTAVVMDHTCWREEETGEHKAVPCHWHRVPTQLIRLAGTLWLPAEQVKRHPGDVKRSRPSGDERGTRGEMSCEPERGQRSHYRVGWHTRAWRQNEIIHSGTAEVAWLQGLHHQMINPCRGVAPSWVEFEKAGFPQFHEIHLDRGLQGELTALAPCQRGVKEHMNYEASLVLIHKSHAFAVKRSISCTLAHISISWRCGSTLTSHVSRLKDLSVFFFE